MKLTPEQAPTTHELSASLQRAKVRDRLAFSYMFDHACELERELADVRQRNYEKSCILDHIVSVLGLPNESSDQEIEFAVIEALQQLASRNA